MKKSSVQFSRSVVFSSLRLLGLQHARPPCPSSTPRVGGSLLKLMSSELVMPSNHLILCHLLLCHPLLLLPSISPSIRVISNESVLRIRWPKYWSFSISLSNEYSGLISFRVSDPYLTVHDSPLLSGQSVCSMALEGLTSALSQASLHCPCSPSMFLLLRAFLQTASSTWEEPLLFPFRLILRFSA